MRKSIIPSLVVAFLLGITAAFSYQEAKLLPHQDMLGADIDIVLQKYGKPDSSTFGAQVVQITYKGVSGGEGRFTFSSGKAFEVPGAKFVAAAPKTLRSGKDGILWGQKLEDAAKVLGNPADVSIGSISVIATYANGQKVSVVRGRVFD